LLKYVHDRVIGHLGYFKERHVDFVMETRTCARSRPGRWRNCGSWTPARASLATGCGSYVCRSGAEAFIESTGDFDASAGIVCSHRLSTNMAFINRPPTFTDAVWSSMLPRLDFDFQSRFRCDAAVRGGDIVRGTGEMDLSP
jgi:hypothetical protein